MSVTKKDFVFKTVVGREKMTDKNKKFEQYDFMYMPSGKKEAMGFLMNKLNGIYKQLRYVKDRTLGYQKAAKALGQKAQVASVNEYHDITSSLRKGTLLDTAPIIAVYFNANLVPLDDNSNFMGSSNIQLKTFDSYVEYKGFTHAFFNDNNTKKANSFNVVVGVYVGNSQGNFLVEDSELKSDNRNYEKVMEEIRLKYESNSVSISANHTFPNDMLYKVTITLKEPKGLIFFDSQYIDSVKENYEKLLKVYNKKTKYCTINYRNTSIRDKKYNMVSVRVPKSLSFYTNNLSITNLYKLIGMENVHLNISLSRLALQELQ